MIFSQEYVSNIITENSYLKSALFRVKWKLITLYPKFGGNVVYNWYCGWIQKGTPMNIIDLHQKMFKIT